VAWTIDDVVVEHLWNSQFLGNVVDPDQAVDGGLVVIDPPLVVAGEDSGECTCLQ